MHKQGLWEYGRVAKNVGEGSQESGVNSRSLPVLAAGPLHGSIFSLANEITATATL